VDPAATFEAFLGEAAIHLDQAGSQELKLTAMREYEVNAHWALYCGIIWKVFISPMCTSR
jgi:hypothetical protein